MKAYSVKQWIVPVCTGLVLGCVAPVVSAQDTGNYPDKPVKIIVGFTAGGTTDIIARAMAAELVKEMPDATFVVENKPGAGGDIGTADVVRSDPDGYTLLMASVGPMAINPSMKNLKHDPRTDLMPIVLVADVPNVLVVHPDSKIKNLEDFQEWAKTRRGELHYASTGTGTSSHLSSHMLSEAMDLDATHVPYKGAEALNDLMAGRTDFMFATIPSVMGQIKSGKLVPIAVSSPQRSRSLPEIPAIAESGLPDFSAGSWFGLLAPAGTPEQIVTFMNEKVNDVLPTLEDRLIAAGADPAGGSAQDFGQFITSEHDKWARVLKSAGIEKP